MGFEYRISIRPAVSKLDEFCDAVFARTEWKRISTSLVDVSDGIGVQCGEYPSDPTRIHDADLCADADGEFYAIAHCTNGIRFLTELAKQIETTGYVVNLDGNYY